MSYSLVYQDSVAMRDFNYASAGRERDDGDWWKNPAAGTPRGACAVGYKVWMRRPDCKAVLLLNCPISYSAFSAFGRIMDLVRSKCGGFRPWRVFVTNEFEPTGWLLYEVFFACAGEEYKLTSYTLARLRDLKGLVGDVTQEDIKSQARLDLT